MSATVAHIDAAERELLERLRAVSLTRITGTLVAKAEVRLRWPGLSRPDVDERQVVLTVRLSQGVGVEWVAEQCRPDTPANWLAASRLAAVLQRDHVVTVHARGALPSRIKGQPVSVLVDVHLIEHHPRTRRAA